MTLFVWRSSYDAVCMTLLCRNTSVGHCHSIGKNHHHNTTQPPQEHQQNTETAKHQNPTTTPKLYRPKHHHQNTNKSTATTLPPKPQKHQCHNNRSETSLPAAPPLRKALTQTHAVKQNLLAAQQARADLLNQWAEKRATQKTPHGLYVRLPVPSLQKDGHDSPKVLRLPYKIHTGYSEVLCLPRKIQHGLARPCKSIAPAAQQNLRTDTYISTKLKNHNSARCSCKSNVRNKLLRTLLENALLVRPWRSQTDGCCTVAHGCEPKPSKHASAPLPPRINLRTLGHAGKKQFRGWIPVAPGTHGSFNLTVWVSRGFWFRKSWALQGTFQESNLLLGGNDQWIHSKTPSRLFESDSRSFFGIVRLPNEFRVGYFLDEVCRDNNDKVIWFQQAWPLRHTIT